MDIANIAKQLSKLALEVIALKPEDECHIVGTDLIINDQRFRVLLTIDPLNFEQPTANEIGNALKLLKEESMD